MKLILSRKGFDSGSGGFPSPIVDGKPISLPIPETKNRSSTTYGSIGLGKLVETVTNGKIPRSTLCHHDPVFQNGRCALGQAHSAQGHLENQGIGIGDVFLFFGLFANLDGSDVHHRIFGYLRIEDIWELGKQTAGLSRLEKCFRTPHPHTLGSWPQNNCIYQGEGANCLSTPNALRLTVAKSELQCTTRSSMVSCWKVPTWLQKTGLTYHRPDQWQTPARLQATRRGQEFVADITESPEGRDWVEKVIEAVTSKG